MSRVVLDASAILAAANNETGAEAVLAHISEAVVSTVNLAEVQGKLIERGLPGEDAWEIALSFCNEVVPFDEQQARMAGEMIASTRSLGLSLGDRACLSLAKLLRVPVLTTDRQWKKLHLGVEVQVLR